MHLCENNILYIFIEIPDTFYHKYHNISPMSRLSLAQKKMYLREQFHLKTHNPTKLVVMHLQNNKYIYFTLVSQ